MVIKLDYKWNKVINQIGTAPRPRHGHKAVVIKDLIVIFGGGNEGIIDELHVFNTSTKQWFTPVVKGDIPPGCAAFGFVADNTSLFLFGGMLEYGKYSGDLYELHASRWEWKKMRPRSPVNGFLPAPRIGHSFTLVGDYVVLFGGLTNESEDPRTNVPKYLNDLYVITTNMTNNSALAWEMPNVRGPVPCPRESHSMVSYRIHTNDVVPNLKWRLLLYGGMNGQRLGDLWLLDMDNWMWTPIEAHGNAPLPRSLHTANVIGTKMFVFGGWVPSQHREDDIEAAVASLSNFRETRGFYDDNGNNGPPDASVCDFVMTPHQHQLDGRAEIPERVYQTPHPSSCTLAERNWQCTNSLAVFDLQTQFWDEVYQPETFPISSLSMEVQNNNNNLNDNTSNGIVPPIIEPDVEEEIPRPRSGHCSLLMQSRLYIWSGRDSFKKAWNNQVCHRDLWFLETERPGYVQRVNLLKATEDALEVSWDFHPVATRYFLQVMECVSTKETPPSVVTSSAPSAPLVKVLPSPKPALPLLRPTTPLQLKVVPSSGGSGSSTQPRLIRLVSSGTGGVRSIRPITIVSASPSGVTPKYILNTTPRPTGAISLQNLRPATVTKPPENNRGDVPQLDGSSSNNNVSESLGGEAAVIRVLGQSSIEVEENGIGESDGWRTVGYISGSSASYTVTETFASLQEYLRMMEQRLMYLQEEERRAKNDTELLQRNQSTQLHSNSASIMEQRPERDFSRMRHTPLAPKDLLDDAKNIIVPGEPLRAGVAYRFRVAAVNSIGRGPWSEVSAFRTVMPGFPGAPSSVRINKTDFGVHLVWDKPFQGQEPVLEYSVYLAVNKPASDTSSGVGGGKAMGFSRVYLGVETEAKISSAHLMNAYLDQGLKPAIIFRIAARNLKGYGPATQVRWLQDSTATPSGAASIASGRM